MYLPAACVGHLAGRGAGAPSGACLQKAGLRHHDGQTAVYGELGVHALGHLADVGKRQLRREHRREKARLKKRLWNMHSTVFFLYKIYKNTFFFRYY